MANWTFDPTQYEEKNFQLIPVGDHRLRVADVVERDFKSGNHGYEITMNVSGYGSKLWHYIVLDPSNPAQTNQKLGEFFDSFHITNPSTGTGKQWVGAVGAARVKHENYNGKDNAKIHYLLRASEQDKLPPWKDAGNANAAPAPAPVEEVTLPDDLPFSVN